MIAVPIDPRASRERRTVASSIVARIGLAAAAMLAGCTVTETVQTTAETDLGPATRAEAAAEGTGPRTTRGSLRYALEPRGAVSFDAFTLPMASPDGQLLVSRTGDPPDWSTALAEPEAPVPNAARIEVHRLAPDGGSPSLVAIVEVPALLGRSADDEGFIVEAPREGGARWIGRADWASGAVTWLASDDAVNAFAALGPGGRVAWSRLDRAGGSFDLVVRIGDGSTWTLPGAGGDWLMPVWSGDGDGLFVLTLRGGFLDLVYGDAADAESWESGQRRIALATRAGRGLAYQTLCGQVAPSEAIAEASEPRVVFYHPARGGMAVWAPKSGRLDVLEPGSVNAALVGDDRALITTSRELRLQTLGAERSASGVASGLHVARAVHHPDWSFILLGPGEQTVQVTALRVLE